MASVATEYISVGGNRHPAAADWDVESGVLAFGADNNVALWDPLVSMQRANDRLEMQIQVLTCIIFRSLPSAGSILCLSVIPTRSAWLDFTHAPPRAPNFF